MAYLQLYIYRVPKNGVKEFLEISSRARTIYEKHGASGEEIFRLADGAQRYGLTGVSDVVPTSGNEELWVGLNFYESSKRCEEIMAAVDEEPEITELFKRAVNLIGSADRVIRGEFDEIDY
ncbi:MAG: DUF1428 family protein [Candidatus Coatesbacteria bacterium]|nr:MAG: DUF1428 family protein [Candidatus Coatesbacteria bacterium]